MHITQVSMFLDFLNPPKLNPKGNVKLKELMSLIKIILAKHICKLT